MDVVLEERRNGLDGQYIVDLIVDICILLNIESDEVCRGAITVNAVSNTSISVRYVNVLQSLLMIYLILRYAADIDI